MTVQVCASASCHRIFKDFDEMERQQVHVMWIVVRLCEISLSFQCAGLWPPPQPRGAGAVVAIPEEGRIRERKPTRWLPLQALPIPWTVGGIASGGGADGEGANTPEDLRTLGDNEH